MAGLTGLLGLIFLDSSRPISLDKIPFGGNGQFVESLSTLFCRSSASQHGFNLFLVGFLVLFLELAGIRWFSAYVWFPFIALTTVTAAFAMFVIYHFWHSLAVDVGHQASPQEVFFGTEYRFISASVAAS